MVQVRFQTLVFQNYPLPWAIDMMVCGEIIIWKRQEQQRTNSKQQTATSNQQQQPQPQQQQPKQHITYWFFRNYHGNKKILVMIPSSAFFFSQVAENKRTLPSGHIWDDALLRCAFRALDGRKAKGRLRRGRHVRHRLCQQHPN